MIIETFIFQILLKKQTTYESQNDEDYYNIV